MSAIKIPKTKPNKTDLMETPQEGNKVKVHYKGTLEEDGSVFDSSYDRDPIEFTIGEGQIIPGLENAVQELKQGEQKQVRLSSEEAFGERDDNLIQQVPKSQLPSDVQPEEGKVLQAQTDGGQQMRLVITDVGEENITVDANHPLAGKNLLFDVELVEISQ